MLIVRCALLAFSCLSVASPTAAQGFIPGNDLDRYATSIGLEAIPTMEEIAAGLATGDERAKLGSCSIASYSWAVAGKAAHTLANLTAQSVAPYLEADEASKKSAQIAAADELSIAFEKLTMLRGLRDRAWLSIAECDLTEGRVVQAAAQLHMLFEHLDPADGTTYERALRLQQQLY